MENSIVLKIFLAISGLLLVYIGGSFLIIPKKMKDGQGIDIAGDINMLAETRSASALILVFAILIILGIFQNSLTYISTLVSVLVLLSLGGGRLISILLDGIPVKALVIATIVELALGVVGGIIFFVFKE